MTADESPVLFRRDGAVATLTLNRPQRLNAISLEMGQALLEHVRAIGKDPEIRAVVLTGAGRGFSAGADFGGSDIPVNPAGYPDLRGRLDDLFNPCIVEMRAMPQPIVAAVNGVTAGIGMSFALACDLILAAESASFLFAFSGIALSPDGGLIAHAAARIGFTRTAQLALLGDRVPAKQALDWGLINAVHPDAELGAEAQAVAAKLAAGPTVAHAGAKEQLTMAVADLAGRLAREAHIQQRNGEAADFAEGVAAFQEKRPAKFLGR
ncbi:MAG TPA: enoyl-CoA hydratase-related protein [Sporichthya sp.]|nr:enoyl-CoA hydratase-related protein [Sporichthya sp.]